SPGGEREARNELFFLRLAGEGGFDARRRQGHAAHAHTDGVEHGIADRGRYRRGGGFARAERLVLRTADHVDLEHRRVGEGDDRIAPPIDAGDFRLIEGRFLIQRAAYRLHDVAFDLV